MDEVLIFGTPLKKVEIGRLTVSARIDKMVAELRASLDAANDY